MSTSLTPTQRNAVHRIERERSTLAGNIRRRLVTRAATLATETRKGRALQANDFADVIAPGATIAYFRGVKRAVLDANAALKTEVRTAHLALSREDDRKRHEREVLAALLLFLGFGGAELATVRRRSQVVAQNASTQLILPAAKKLVAAKQAAVQANAPSPNVPQVTPPVSTSSEVLDKRFTGPAFDKAGIGKGDRYAIDTWAETVAYSQYEAGRHDAGGMFPAISEALWGYRWSSVLDSRTSQTCRTLDGFVAPLDDPYMRDLIPPLHFFCRSVRVPVYQSSALKAPTPYRPPHLTDATLQRYLAQRETFNRYLA